MAFMLLPDSPPRYRGSMHQYPAIDSITRICEEPLPNKDPWYRREIYPLDGLDDALIRNDYETIIKDEQLFRLLFYKTYAVNKHRGQALYIYLTKYNSIEIRQKWGADITCAENYIEIFREQIVKNYELKKDVSIDINFGFGSSEITIDGASIKGMYRYNLNFEGDYFARIEKSIKLFLDKLGLVFTVDVKEEGTFLIGKIITIKISWDSKKHFVYQIPPQPIEEQGQNFHAMYLQYNRKEFCDFTIQAKGGEIKVHRSLLASFGGSFFGNQCISNALFDSDNSVETWQLFAEYLYEGTKGLEKEIAKDSTYLFELLGLAYRLNLDPLVDCCANLITSLRGIDSATITKIAQDHDNSHLKKFACFLNSGVLVKKSLLAKRQRMPMPYGRADKRLLLPLEDAMRLQDYESVLNSRELFQLHFLATYAKECKLRNDRYTARIVDGYLILEEKFSSEFIRLEGILEFIREEINTSKYDTNPVILNFDFDGENIFIPNSRPNHGPLLCTFIYLQDILVSSMKKLGFSLEYETQRIDNRRDGVLNVILKKISRLESEKVVYRIPPKEIPERESISSVLYQQYLNGEFCDFTIRGEGGNIAVHLHLLASAGGEYFKVLLTESDFAGLNEHTNGTFSVKTWKYFAEYLYHGYKRIIQIFEKDKEFDVFELLSLAEYYVVEPLEDCCVNLITTLKDQNPEKIRSLAETYTNKHLLEFASFLDKIQMPEKIDIDFFLWKV